VREALQTIIEVLFAFTGTLAVWVIFTTVREILK
jgi:hypothetical protein